MIQNKPIALFIIILITYLNLHSQTLDELLARGDIYANNSENSKAIEVYKLAEVLYPDNWNVYLRLSEILLKDGNDLPKIYFDINKDVKMRSGSDEEKNIELLKIAEELKSAKLVKYENALEYASKAVRLAPRESKTFLKRAAANVRIASTKGIFSVTEVVDSIRSDIDKAIKIGNGGDAVQAMAHYLKARLHYQICEEPGLVSSVVGLGWADTDTAIVEYKKAIELVPDFRRFYLDYAKALIQADDEQNAILMLEKVQECPENETEDNEHLEEAIKLLSELRDEE
jgi:tetratricopeptide (TPR) repeat protein